MQHTYIIARHKGVGCTETEVLGTFESPFKIERVWDIVFRIFCGDGSNGGMFAREISGGFND